MDRIAHFNGFTLENFKKYLANIYDEIYGNSIFGINFLSKYKIALEWAFKRTISVDEIPLIGKTEKFEIGGLRVCRDCLLNKVYIRFYWRFKDYSVCHIHGINLFLSPSLNYNNSASYESLKICRFQPRHKHLIALIRHSQVAVDALSVIRDEMHLISSERLLVGKICHFFNKRFKLRLKGKFAIKCIEAGYLIGLSMSARIDKLIHILCRKHKRYLSRVKTMSILFSVETVYSDMNAYYWWARKEAFRISEIYDLYEALNSTCLPDKEIAIKKLTPLVAHVYAGKVIHSYSLRSASTSTVQEAWIYSPNSLFQDALLNYFFLKYQIKI